MKYSVHVEKESLLITLEGKFTFLDSLAFHKLLHSIRLSNDHFAIRLNIKLLESIDAAALALLLQAHDTAKQLHRPLTFEEPQGQVEIALATAARFNALMIAA